MSRIDISALSDEYIRMKVYAKESGTVVDPTAFPVEMAVLTTVDASPEELDWQEAEWETSGATFYARMMVGPSTDTVLVAGDIYKVWVRITATPEIPVAGLGWVQAY